MTLFGGAVNDVDDLVVGVWSGLVVGRVEPYHSSYKLQHTRRITAHLTPKRKGHTNTRTEVISFILYGLSVP